ncbi:hypothetical protein BaRGS_00032621 [Batillaria attramentaria]|uniref:Arrestin C-terminal-like domain-containing protein n=1 Tax=Batillaria attramentaria TaxID=370345 RepID=A0ABD0JN90_9CAEN
MGKLQNLHLVLSRPEEDAVYEPGDHVDGYVIVEVKDTMKVKDLVVEFVGQAGVQWNESVSGSADKHRRVNMRHYSATEKYFSFHQQLLGADSDSISGRMSLPFRFRLPHNIPSSFTSAVGHVKYVLSVRLSRSWGSDRHDNLAVCVRRPLSLDQEADFLSPEENGDEMTLCCLCCKSGPVSCTLRLQRRAFVPGETIPFHGEITNKSRRTISTCARLMMRQQYRTSSKTKVVNTEERTVEGASVNPGERRVWEGQGLEIPTHLPTSGPRGCKIIDISYWVELCVNPSGISFTLVVPLPVVLGDVPLSAKYIDLLRQHKDRTVGRHGNGRGSRDENRRHVDETRSPNAEDGKFLRTVNAVHPGVERMMTYIIKHLTNTGDNWSLPPATSSTTIVDLVDYRYRPRLLTSAASATILDVVDYHLRPSRLSLHDLVDYRPRPSRLPPATLATTDRDQDDYRPRPRRLPSSTRGSGPR